MAKRVKVYPSTDFLLAFLQTRGLLIVEDEPDVLHYAGTDIKELKELIALDDPDFVVTHNIQAFKELPEIPQVFHPVVKMSDFNTVGDIWTNNFELCRIYYRTLGLQTKINVMPLPKKIVKTPAKSYNILKKIKIYSQRFKQFMLWD